MNKLITILASAVLALLFTAVTAGEPQAWKVSARITDGGESVGRPVVIMDREQPARMEVSGEAGYTLVLDIVSADARSAHLATQLTRGGETVEPAVEAEYGETASVRVGELELALTVEPFGG